MCRKVCSVFGYHFVHDDSHFESVSMPLLVSVTVVCSLDHSLVPQWASKETDVTQVRRTTLPCCISSIIVPW